MLLCITLSPLRDKSHTAVCFDIVPHVIDTLVEPVGLQSLIEASNVVISEACTLSRIFGQRVIYPATDQDLPSVVESFCDAYGSSKCLIIRYGESNISRTAICRGRHIEMSYDTGYLTHPDPVGFGDRLACAELAALMEFYPSYFQDD